MYCTKCGQSNAAGANFCWSCGTRLVEPPSQLQPNRAQAENISLAPDGDERTIATIADYERASAIIWLILAIVQILSIVAIIAGIWNLVASLSRFKIAPLIRQRDANVPEMYESIVQLVVIGAINLLLGGGIGLIFVAFDFYIRHLVLENRRLFTERSASSVPPAPSSADHSGADAKVD